ncbi:MAG: hypothetical protein KGJ62_09120 [Armatimonadetes bacterium]|nr:hypothetical protein [Armatimonadota bacterium]MDE2207605.1 hypothetical protein [Armatimonadota bacterium]
MTTMPDEGERSRILRLVAEGALTAEQAALILDTPVSPHAGGNGRQAGARADAKSPDEKPRVAIQMQRPDGSQYTLHVAPGLMGMIWKLAGVAIKESAKNAARDTWEGVRIMVTSTSRSAGKRVRRRFRGSAGAAEDLAQKQIEARRRVLGMVAEGRISAEQAARLMSGIEAAYQPESPTVGSGAA